MTVNALQTDCCELGAPPCYFAFPSGQLDSSQKHCAAFQNRTYDQMASANNLTEDSKAGAQDLCFSYRPHRHDSGVI